MKKIRVGLAGGGFVAELHMHAYRRVYGVDVEVRAVAARGDHVVDFATRHRIPTAYRSFRDLMLSAYAALGATPNIQYIDMPEAIRGSYQYFTQSEVDRLLRAGYNGGFTALEDAVDTYVKGFLDRADRFR